MNHKEFFEKIGMGVLMFINSLLMGVLFFGYRYSQKKVFDERMSTLSFIVVSLNHEMNNPLTIIKAYLKISKKWKNDEGDFVSTVSSMMNVIERIEDVIRKISNIDKIDFANYSLDQQTKRVNLRKSS